MKISYFLTALLSVSLLSSCLVSKKKFDAEQLKAATLYAEKTDCLKRAAVLQDSVALLIDKYNTLSSLQKSTDEAKNKLQKEADMLAKELEGTAAQLKSTQKLLDEVSNKSIADKSKLHAELLEKEKQLNDKQLALAANAKSLAEREKKIQELENLLKQKEQAVAELKKKVAAALSGFSTDELNVTERDGKIYVSMSDKLLFKSGSTKVDDKGKQALMKLAEELNKNPEIGIEVEGHTDSIPYINPKGEIKNNWDLSVLRATMVTTILTQDGKLPANNVKPSGRGENFPVATNSTPEGRSKNRRTEIILTPNLADIMKLLNE